MQAGRSGDAPDTDEPSGVAIDSADDEAVETVGLSEHRYVYASEPTDQFWQWRRTWFDEAPDNTWADQLRTEATERMGDILRSSISLHQIDCRETMCQLYLHTDGGLDDQAILEALREDWVEVEHQEIAANIQIEGAPIGGTTHEVVVRRARPQRMPPHVPGAAGAHRSVVEASEGIE